MKSPIIKLTSAIVLFIFILSSFIVAGCTSDNKTEKSTPSKNTSEVAKTIDLDDVRGLFAIQKASNIPVKFEDERNSLSKILDTPLKKSDAIPLVTINENTTEPNTTQGNQSAQKSIDKSQRNIPSLIKSGDLTSKSVRYYYWGPLKNKRPDGIGVLMDEDQYRSIADSKIPRIEKCIYIGNFKNGQIQGYGLLKTTEGFIEAIWENSDQKYIFLSSYRDSSIILNPKEEFKGSPSFLDKANAEYIVYIIEPENLKSFYKLSHVALISIFNPEKYGIRISKDKTNLTGYASYLVGTKDDKNIIYKIREANFINNIYTDFMLLDKDNINYIENSYRYGLIKISIPTTSNFNLGQANGELYYPNGKLAYKGQLKFKGQEDDNFSSAVTYYKTAYSTMGLRAFVPNGKGVGYNKDGSVDYDGEWVDGLYK